jgi:Toluene-4-monooxygenase system protein B (TmoB)
MSMFPITGRFVGDFVPHLVAVDTGDTMDELAGKVAVHSVGRRVPSPADPPGYDVLLDGRRIPASTTLGELMEQTSILPLQWFDVRFRQETVDAR